MNCEDVRPLLYRFLEDRLLDDDAEAVCDHVERCVACSDRYRRITALDESVLEVEDEHPSPQLRKKLLSAYRRHMKAKAASKTAWFVTTSVVRRAAAIGLIMFASSGGTWLALRGENVKPAGPTPVTGAAVSLDGLFPLLINDSYTLVDEDGRTQRGSNIRIIQ